MIKISKYGESIGRFELRVAGFDKEITPKKGDARRLLKIMLEAKDKGTAYLFDNFETFVKDMIRRDYPPINETERDELDMFVEYNLIQLLIEIQIAFRFVTREDIERQKKEALQTPTGEIQPQQMIGIGSQIKSLNQLKRTI